MMRSFTGLLFLLISAVAAAQTDTVRVTAQGYGSDPAGATTAALVEAARQGLGTGVTLDPAFRTAIHEWVIEHREDGRLITGRWSSEPEAQLPVMASLKSYQVLETTEVKSGLWRSRVEARLLEYTGHQADKRHLPALVIAPFRTSQDQYLLGNQRPAGEVRAQLRRHLENAFQQSGDVRVLDRSFTAAAEDETDTATENLSPEQQIKRGQTLGADLLLVGRIEAFSLGENRREFYGTSFNTLEPHVLIHYRLMDTATREILRADRFRYRKLPASLREDFREEKIDPEEQPERIGEILYPRVATALTGAILETLYPVHVLSVNDGTVYLSAGKGRIREGDLLSAHRTALKSRDPETDLPIHVETAALTTLRVVAVHDGYAEAEFLGDSEAELDGDVILRIQAREEPSESPEEDREMTPGSSEQPLEWE